MDREKVIKGMEQFRSDFKPFCGGKADWERFDAGLALLKEQENSVPLEPLADWLSHYAAPPVRLGIDFTMEDLKKAWRATLEGIK